MGLDGPAAGCHFSWSRYLQRRHGPAHVRTDAQCQPALHTRAGADIGGLFSGRWHLEHALYWHAGVCTLCQWRFFDLVQRPVGHAQPAGGLVGDARAAAPRHPWPAPVGQWQPVCNWHRCHALRRHDRFGHRQLHLLRPARLGVGRRRRSRPGHPGAGSPSAAAAIWRPRPLRHPAQWQLARPVGGRHALRRDGCHLPARRTGGGPRPHGP